MQPIQDVFAQINDRINEEMAAHPEYADDVLCKTQNSIFRRIVLGHVRYGTLEKQYRVYILLRQNNWMHRNLILAGNLT
jgi:amidophosphoribosyltransferase